MKRLVTLALSILICQQVLFAQEAHLLMDINPGSEGSFEFNQDRSFIVFQDRLFFAASSAEHGLELWQYDGENTSLFKDINPGEADANVDNLYILKDQLVFIADDGTHGEEWWISDGTPEGTHMIVDLREGAESGAINCCNSELGRTVIVYNDELFFNSNTSNFNRSLFKTDGTEEGTVQVAVLNHPQRSAEKFTIFEGVLYFSVFGEGFWKTDGTTDGTVVIKTDDHEGNRFEPFYTYVMGDYMIMVNGTDWDVWRSDGTEEGTVLVKDMVNAGALNNQGLYFINYNDVALFSGGQEPNNGELWRSDGTDAGTYEVIDLEDDDAFIPIVPRRKVHFKDLIYYIGGKDETGFQIYRTDGTEEGTKAVTMLDETGNGEVYFQSDLLATDDYIFFVAGAAFNRELWFSDGSNAYEIEVNPNGASTPERFMMFQDKLIFFANGDGTGYEPHYVDISEISVSTKYANVVDHAFIVYPNPSSGQLSISTDFDYQYVRVFDVQGKQVMGVSNTSNLDVSNLPGGTYYVQIENVRRNERAIEKFVKVGE